MRVSPTLPIEMFVLLVYNCIVLINRGGSEMKGGGWRRRGVEGGGLNGTKEEQ